MSKKQYSNAISKPTISWTYMNLAVDIVWKVKSSKMLLLHAIEYFHIVYKERRLNEGREPVQSWALITEVGLARFLIRQHWPMCSWNIFQTDVGEVIPNKHFRGDYFPGRGPADRASLGNCVLNSRTDALSNFISDVVGTNGEPVASNSNIQYRDGGPPPFRFVLRNSKEHKPLKPQHEYIVQIKYYIEDQFFTSKWSTPVSFDNLLDIPPPEILSVLPESHGIRWKFDSRLWVLLFVFCAH